MLKNAQYVFQRRSKWWWWRWRVWWRGLIMLPLVQETPWEVKSSRGGQWPERGLQQVTQPEPKGQLFCSGRILWQGYLCQQLASVETFETLMKQWCCIFFLECRMNSECGNIWKHSQSIDFFLFLLCNYVLILFMSLSYYWYIYSIFLCRNYFLINKWPQQVCCQAMTVACHNFKYINNLCFYKS